MASDNKDIKILYRPPKTALRRSSRFDESNEPKWAVPVGTVILVFALVGFLSVVRGLVYLL